jgi:hypothetical protein
MYKLIVLVFLASGCSFTSVESTEEKVKPGCEAVDKEIKWCLDNVKALEGTKDFPKVKEAVQSLCDAYVDKAKQCIRR